MTEKIKIGDVAAETGLSPAEVYGVLRALVDSGWFAWRYVHGDDTFAAAQDAWCEQHSA